MANNPRLIIGLGNPGDKYDLTRHNVGFWVVDAVAQALGLTWEAAPKLKGLVAKNAEIVLLKPQTYMNLSGESAVLTQKFYKTGETWVICDDLNLPTGTLRTRMGGSAGGHNGLKSLIRYLGEDFVRYRVGVGPQPPYQPAEDFVLQRLAGTELKNLLFASEQTAHYLVKNLSLAQVADETVRFDLA